MLVRAYTLTRDTVKVSVKHLVAATSTLLVLMGH
jgi:hypothetical protein